MIKKYGTWLLSLGLLIALVYSFFQFYNTQSDGDLAYIVAPGKSYSEVLKDPFALQVILEDKVYSAPNRFFAHWSLYTYFHQVPQLFHSITDPIESFFLSCATAKIFMKIGLVLLMAMFVAVERPTFKNTILAAALVMPLFQTFGYTRTMGIIDLSITYSFFYALPMLLLMIYFFPFYKGLYREEKISLSWWGMLLLPVLAVVLALNGPLTPAVALVVCTLVLLTLWYDHFQQSTQPLIQRGFAAIKAIPGPVLFYFMLISLLSLYSIYVGRNNDENGDGSVSILERYSRIPLGIFKVLTGKLGLPLLLIGVFGNVYMLKRLQTPNHKKLISLLKWIGIFSLIFILLLPFGGYRPYRPNIVRYDTIIPITLCLIYFFGISTLSILTELQARWNKIYIPALVVVLSIFIIAEFTWYHNDCEKQAMYRIYNSPPEEKILVFNTDCNILSWENIEDYRKSEVIMIFLRQQGIAKGEKYFYQKKN